MGGGHGLIIASYTAISLCGVVWRINLALNKVLSDGATLEEGIESVQAGNILQLLLESSVTVALLANLAINIFILIALFVKVAFFGQLSSVETRKVVERLINYILYKGIFLIWIVQPDIVQIALWLTWFSVLGSLKMFQGLAKDRLERLNASPSATPWAHLRVFSVLVFVLFFDLLWIQLCTVVSRGAGTSTFWLLLFEPLSIAFETLQAVMVHGLQLIETWHRYTADDTVHCQGLQPSDRSAAGASWEWKGTIVRNCGFFMEVVTLLMALGHCLHIWWLRGLAFQLVDAVLFLNLRALLSAILRRIKSFLRLRAAMNTLQGALPDATQDELRAYDDECAICKEPMARAKRLPCAHLFHLPCLRSWLDQGIGETYSCPTCRRPLFTGSSRRSPNATVGQQLVEGEQLVRPVNTGPDGMSQSMSDNTLPVSPFSTQRWNSTGIDMFRGVGLDPGWVNPWPNAGLDGAGPSTGMRSVGFERVQMMMRQLAGVSGNYAHGTSSEDNSWRAWSMGPHDGSSAQATFSGRQRTAAGGLRFRNTMSGHMTENNGMPDIINVVDPRITAMANMVREVLPHIQDEIIIQDLRRTNSVTVTVNNLL
uniref:TSA: Wollemia nobilis Ref_Wollemi_Transcript_22094_2583 transcribed RNA sequence n=1 Tax=Wollemia nobilis TaxID=56998 RepID=A0A0C9RQW2_9CONI